MAQVGAQDSASVTVQDDDTATFAVSADAEAISEGHSATLTVAIANGVTFATNQTIDLAASGTASAADYTLVPAALTLALDETFLTLDPTPMHADVVDGQVHFAPADGQSCLRLANSIDTNAFHDELLSVIERPA